MAQFVQKASGVTFDAGSFLANAEDCTRVTMQIAQNHASVKTGPNGGKYVPAGVAIPANSSSAVGILYEDVDVTDGAMPGSVIIEGIIYGDRLPAVLESDAKTAMKGIQVISSAPAVARPTYFNYATLVALTVASAAGSAAGKTALTVSGHTLATGEKYKVKSQASTAPAAALGDDLSAWTDWDGSADVTATTDHKITVAVVDATNHCVAAGNATVTSHA